jgi:hypothetical protein
MSIRTTVVLDDDVLERVRETAQQENVSFRQKLNDLIRDGLAKPKPNPKQPFVSKTFKMGTCSLPFPLRIADLDAIDDQTKLR